jgi:hypothetical protein
MREGRREKGEEEMSDEREPAAAALQAAACNR